VILMQFCFKLKLATNISVLIFWIGVRGVTAASLAAVVTKLERAHAKDLVFAPETIQNQVCAKLENVQLMSMGNGVLCRSASSH